MSASKSIPTTGTSGCSDPSGNTTRTVSYGQTTWAFVTTCPPSINTPLPVPAALSIRTIEGATLSKICCEVSGPDGGVAVGFGVGVLVGLGVGVAVGSGVGVAVGSFVEVEAASGSLTPAARAVYVRANSGLADFSDKTYPAGAPWEIRATIAK